MGPDTSIAVTVAVRAPFDSATLLAFFARRAVPGVEEVDGGTYRRSLRLTHGAGVVELTPATDAVTCTAWVDDAADGDEAVRQCRAMFDLDADPVAIDAHLGDDPLLAGLVATRPGLRSPGNPDGGELLVRAMLG